MKKNIIYVATALLMTQFMFSCGGEKTKTETKEVKQEQPKAQMIKKSVSVNTETSVLNWRANKVVGGHEGTFSLEKGTVNLVDNKVVGGEFTFDIASIKVTDVTEEEDNREIVGHLLNEDFFDATKHPKAYFTVTSVKGDMMTGNLKMKDVEKPISFKMNTSVKGNMFSLTSEKFEIDRTKWGITYNSGSFFDAAKLGNYMIKDAIEITVSVQGQLK
ncbi:MAG: YceI family protein [Flavobacteriales bacterium]